MNKLIHIIEHSPLIRLQLAEILRSSELKIIWFDKPHDYIAYSRSEAFEMPLTAIVESCLPGLSGYEMISKVKSLHPQLNSLVIGGEFHIPSAYKHLKCRFLRKPLQASSIHRYLNLLGDFQQLGLSMDLLASETPCHHSDLQFGQSVLSIMFHEAKIAPEETMVCHNREIHIVDDTSFVRDLLTEIVEDLGYQARSYAAPDDYLAYTKRFEFTPPLALFTDVTMPYMNGYKMIDTLKSVMPETKFVIVTGEPEIRNQYKNLACMYLRKPFHPDHVEAVLEKVTQCSNCGASDAIGCRQTDHRIHFNLFDWHCPDGAASAQKA